MNVLLVNPSSGENRRAGPYSRTLKPIAPLGLAYLAAVARKAGHRVAVEDQYASGIDAAGVAALARELGADVVGFACLAPSTACVSEAVAALRADGSRAHVTLGHLHASYFADDLLRDLPIDSVVFGEGEIGFGELLARLDSGAPLDGIDGVAARSDEGVARGGAARLVPDLDDLPAPAWDLFRVEDYPCPPRFMMQGPLVTLAASRGCPWDCTYCSQNALTPGVRRRDIARVVDEIETTHRERGVTNFGFVDAIFPLKAADGFAFAAMMKERGLVDRVRWGTETRCDLVSREMLAELKSAGCRFLMYGFESASRATLDAVDKRADPKQAIDVMRWSKEIGIGTYGLYMIGFPGETREMARETIRFAKALDTDVASFARVTPYPGSPMYEQHKATLGDVPAHQWNNQYRAEPGEAGWRLPGMSSEEIGALLREANLSYYLRPRLIWRHLRRGTISIGEMARGFAALAHDAAWRAREALRPRSAGVPPV